MKNICLLAWFASLALVTTPAFTAESSGWKIGLGKVNITPPAPVAMSGYGNRIKPFEKVAAEIYAKALVLEDNAGKRAVIVTSDLLGFTAEVAEPICQRIAEKTGLKREQILLTSSHTHAGPAIGLTPPDGNDERAADKLRTIEYTRQLQDKVVDLVTKAAAELKPAKLSWGSGVVSFPMNRREVTPTGIILGVNPRGLADRSVPVLRVDDTDGKLLAILFQAGAHNTTLGGDNYQICGDYAGYAQAELEAQHPGAQTMFMLGCAGDANPYPRGTMEIAREHGTTLAKEVNRVLAAGKLQPVADGLSVTFEQTELPLEQSLARPELERRAKLKGGASFAAIELLKRLDKGEPVPSSYKCPLAVWKLGDLTLVALSGEVVVEYLTRIEQSLGQTQLWVAAYSNDVYGYLPSAQIVKEGGYESRGLYSGGVGYFDSQAEKVVVDKVRDLAVRAGRKLP